MRRPRSAFTADTCADRMFLIYSVSRIFRGLDPLVTAVLCSDEAWDRQEMQGDGCRWMLSQMGSSGLD